MLINAFIVALSHLHVRWENKRYERSRWMIVIALIGFAIQYVIQMGFGFRAADDSIGAVVNILIYMPCFFAYIHGNLQHSGHTFQPQKDDTDV